MENGSEHARATPNHMLTLYDLMYRPPCSMLLGGGRGRARRASGLDDLQLRHGGGDCTVFEDAATWGK